MAINSEELTEFIKSVSKSIIESTPNDFKIYRPLKFDLAVISTTEEGTKISIKIAQKDDTKSDKVISRIQFEYSPKRVFPVSGKTV